MPIKCFNSLCNHWESESLGGCGNLLYGILKCKEAIIEVVKESSIYQKHKEDSSDINFFKSVKELNECACGEYKIVGFLFCYGCFMTIPFDMKTGLLKGSQLERQEAYEKAHKYLEGEGRL